MKDLESLLGSDQIDSLQDLWESTEAARAHTLVPSGEYEAHIVETDTRKNSNGKPYFRLTFEIAEGEFIEQRVHQRLYLTEPAMPGAKRDLQVLGITSFKQLNQPLQKRFHCRIKVVLQKQDDGTEFNDVKRFNVLSTEELKSDPFAPTGESDAATELSDAHWSTDETKRDQPPTV